jgi:predicted DNA-binding transcriptional regulator AlpA
MHSTDTVNTVGATEEQEQPRLLSKKEVLARIPVTYPTIWNWMRKGTFPRARIISATKAGWLESEINEWIRARPERNYKSWNR